MRGYTWRQEQEQWRMASIIAAIYDVNRNPKKRRKPITAADILGKKPESRAKARTPESQKAILDALVARTKHMKRSTATNRRRRHPVSASTPQ